MISFFFPNNRCPKYKNSLHLKFGNCNFFILTLIQVLAWDLREKERKTRIISSSKYHGMCRLLIFSLSKGLRNSFFSMSPLYNSPDCLLIVYKLSIASVKLEGQGQACEARVKHKSNFNLPNGLSHLGLSLVGFVVEPIVTNRNAHCENKMPSM